MVGASATALIIASAGFGAFYAWTTGSHHGPVLGALSVIMALGLEGAKPSAIEGALTAARSWSLFRAAALALLGVVAVAYSLTAELSLMAATRADNSAQRARASTVATAAKDRYDATQRELATLPMARPIAALDAEIKRLQMTPKLAPCGDTTARDFGPISRRVCTEITALNAEAGTTVRRTELETKCIRFLDVNGSSAQIKDRRRSFSRTRFAPIHYISRRATERDHSSRLYRTSGCEVRKLGIAT